MGRLARAGFTIATALLVATGTHAATIQNTASATYLDPATGPISLLSNTVFVQTVSGPTPGLVRFFKYAPGFGSSLPTQPTQADGAQCGDGAGGFSPPHALTNTSGSTIDLSAPIPLYDTTSYHAGEPVLMILTDANRNVDPLLRDTIDLHVTSSNGDDEVLRLLETGPNTGVFAGGIQSAPILPPVAVNDCQLSLAPNSTITTDYVDPIDGDTSEDHALVDPFGFVFDSLSGATIDGATVTIIDSDTNAPAVVFSDDGTSSFPATITSGGSASDSSGASYTFPPGGFRFPFVPPGDYRFEIGPPATHTAPSTVPNSVLVNVRNPANNLPYVVVTGSKGETFVLIPGPAIRIDIPVDGLSTVGLTLQKLASRTEVSAGDFVQYQLTLRNATAAPATGLQLTDTLPLGFRYRDDSLHYDGMQASDPIVSGDGRTVTFAVASLAPGATVVITYVVEVTAGAPRGTAVNSAIGSSDSGLSTNRADASVRVREPFFGTCAVLVGRVVEGECSTPQEELEGVGDVRILLDDGTYTSTDPNGQFHFEKVCDGTHVVQLDLDSLPPDTETIPCIQNTRFAGRSFSQFVDVQGGTLWRTDFYVRRKPQPSATVGIRMETALVSVKAQSAPPAESREYSLQLEFETGSAELRPEGLRAVQELARQLRANAVERVEVVGHTDAMRIRPGGRFADNQELSEARAQTVAALLRPMLDLPPDSITSTGRGESEPIVTNATAEGRARNRRVELQVFQREVGEASAEGSPSRRYRIEVDGGHVPVRNLRVIATLPKDAMYLAGTASADGQPLADPDIAGDTLTFSLGDVGADWRRVIEFSATAASSDAAAASALAVFDTDAAADQRTPAAEAIPYGAQSARKEIEAEAKPRAQRLSGAVAAKREIPDDATAAGGKTDWLSAALTAPGNGWLFPPENHNPRAPVQRVVVRHEPGQRVVLSINGAAVDALNFDGTEQSADGRVAVSVWRGIPLSEGDNQLAADLVDSNGAVVQKLSRVVHYANSPARAELVLEQSVLVADGIARPVLAVRFLDRDGKPVRAGVTGPFALGAPYLAQQMIDRQQTRQLAGLDNFQTVYMVEGDEGIAYIELQPTTESGQVVLDLSFQSDYRLERNARRQQLRAWLDASQRDWVLVGFAEGSLGYQTLDGNKQALAEGDYEDDVVTDGQVSFYAKGRVLGKWLLTLAYESDQSEESPHRESLKQVIDPDEFYLIYGDGSEQRYDAPSQEKLYVKLERPQFYALFGDFDTGLTETELSRYSRTMTGLKSEYGGEMLQYNAFASDTAQRFVRDEIQGNGTSGLYRLSGSHIVINSEKIALETRDRIQSQRIIESRTLLRHIDYDIDYTNGTLFFRQPIFSRDTRLNPTFIVADYEVQGGSEKEINAGGRVSTNLLDGRIEAGVSYIRDAEAFGETDLGGVDVTVKLRPDTELRLEAAGSQGEFGGLDEEGGAYLAEVEHFGERFDSAAYVRRQATGFGVGQQFSAENGQEKQGLLGRVPIDEKTAVAGEAYRQENLTNDATRLAGVVRLEREIDKGGVFGGVQYARDENDLGESFESQQVVVGANRKFMKDRLELLGQGDISIGGQNESLDFPSRYLAQAGYDLTKSVTLIVAEEITDGQAFDTQTTRAGAIVNPWQGAKLNSTLNQDFGEYGPRTFGLFGLTQSILLGERWGVDLGVDQSTTFAVSRSSDAPLVNGAGYPIAAGSGAPTLSSTGTPGVFGLSTEDFTAVSAGATYRSDLWSWNGRGELREGETDDRWGVVSNFLREAEAGIAFASSGRIFSAKRSSGTEGLYGSVDLSWAYRPLGSRWSLLDRLEFRLDSLDGGTGIAGSGLFGANSLTAPGDAVSRAVVNNFNLNRVSRKWTQKDRQGNLFDLNQRNQWSFYYGSKYSFDEYDGETYTGYTDLMGAEWRFDVRTWLDVGAQASMLHSWNADNYQFSAGPSVGFTPIDNAWISVGYNVVGFRDRDFDAAKYTAQGVILKLRIKFDQLTRLPGFDADDPRAVNAYRWRWNEPEEPR